MALQFAREDLRTGSITRDEVTDQAERYLRWMLGEETP